MLSKTVGKKLEQQVTDYCVFDLETTGISPLNDEVIEVSAIKVIGGEITEEFSTLVNPQRSIPFAASQVNHITDDMVKNAPRMEEVLQDFLDFVGDLPLVGHNIASFDMKFICRDAMKYFGNTVGNDYMDTLPLSRRYLPELKHHRLTDLAEYYGISQEGAHRALNDCRMNQVVFDRLLKEMEHPSEAAVRADAEAIICPKCGKKMQKRNGRYGEFLGCSGYPMCRQTMHV